LQDKIIAGLLANSLAGLITTLLAGVHKELLQDSL
jgi:hypothetical protein